MGEGLTRAAARNIFYGGSIFFFVVFAALVLHSHWYALNRSTDAAGLTELFAGRTYSASQVEHGKPAPDLFLLAAGAMGAAATRCLVIEDTVPGVIAGKAAGMTVWGFTGGSHCAGRDIGRKLAAAGADRVFDRMSGFFGA